MASPSEDLRSQQIDAAVADYLQAMERGATPEPEAFLARHADIANELRQFLEDFQSLNRVMPGERADASTDGNAGPARSTGGKRRQREPILPLPRRFADFELLEEIARGGMGVVYKARQSNPQRIVALKMILAGQFASQADVDRFSIEAHAAAALDHPRIVPIFEVGQHEGQHYFTMGYVAGESLAQRLLAGPLPAHEATRLIVDVAHTVEFAHGRGIIHRDLKPANILLDADGRVRVTDFGLAKRQTDESGLTNTGQLVGTPSFMSPEQVAGDPSAIGPASDIYSLGATLYSLVTGRPPFQAATTIDTLRQVLERDPVPPRELNANIPRDLETVVLKALAKEAPSRYRTAEEMADDLRRFLDDRPVLARRSTQAERFVRWCRRNPALASLTTTAAVALIAGTVVSTWQAVRARSAENLAEARLSAEVEARKSEATQRGEAEKQRAAAVANSDKAKATVDKYFTLVSESKLFDVPGLQPVRMDLLEMAQQFYEDALQEHTVDPAVLTNLALAHLRLSQIQLAVSRSDDCFLTMMKGLDVIAQLRRDHPDAAEQERKLAGFFKGNRWTQFSVLVPHDLPRAVQTLERMDSQWAELAGRHPDEPRFRGDLAMIRMLLADLLSDSRRPADSLVKKVSAREMVEVLVREQPDVPQYRASLADIYQTLGGSILGTNEEEGLALMDRSQQLSERLVAEFPKVPAYRFELVRCLSERGRTMRSRDLESAEQLLGRAMEMAETAIRDFPGYLYAEDLWFDVGQYWVPFAALRGKYSQVKPSLTRLIAAMEARIKEQPRAYTRVQLARICHLTACGLVDNEHLPLVEQLERRAAIAYVESAHRFPERPWLWELAAWSDHRLIQIFEADGRVAEAHDAYRHGLEAIEQLAHRFPDSQDYVRQFPDHVEYWGLWTDLTAGEESLKAKNNLETTDVMRQRVEAYGAQLKDRPQDRMTRTRLAFVCHHLANRLLHSQRDASAAEPLARRAIDLWRALAAEFPQESKYRGYLDVDEQLIASSIEEAQ